MWRDLADCIPFGTCIAITVWIIGGHLGYFPW